MERFTRQRVKTTFLINGYKVESWKRDGTHTTVLKDEFGNQVGNAEFSGTVEGRNVDHNFFVKRFGPEKKGKK